MKHNAFILYYVALILLICTSAFNSCFAVDYYMDVEFPSSPNPVGSGARALGMGGAFIAVADDATAASWNPGGLIQVEKPEISFVGDAFHRIEDNSFENHPEGNGDQSVTRMGVNYLSAAYPFLLWDYNMIVSLNYQKLYDFHRKWNFPVRSENPLTGDKRSTVFDYQRQGNLSALGIAYCVQVNPQFSFGFTLNIWDDGLGKNEWEEKIFQQGSGSEAGVEYTSEAYSIDKYLFRGLNANFGILWNATSNLTVGAVLKAPFRADLKHEHSFNAAVNYTGLPDYTYKDSNFYSRDEKLDMPMSFGVGFAYSFSSTLTLSADIYRTEWDDFILTDFNGREISPITGQSPGESDIDPTHQVRVGAEYLIITSKYIIPLCAGFFYDPAPARGSPDDFFGFSIGSGIGWKKFHFDIAYQYRSGKNTGSSIVEVWDFSQDVEEHMVYSSVVVHF